MKRILILGAGLSSTSLVEYLLNNSVKYHWKVILGDVNEELAKKKINDHPNGEAMKFDLSDIYKRNDEIKNADVVISMLPEWMHPIVAKDCVRFGTHMITTSYVSKEIMELDHEAREKGVALLNELGVDPGIDHMSVMRIIDGIKAKGGKLLSFKSNTGGLVAPDYDNNPWHYKFTWSPRNVVLAGQGTARLIENGRYKYIPYHQLFKRVENITVLDYGEFEVYPNSDSLSYRKVYGIDGIPTIIRGVMRRPGYCQAWDVFVRLGATEDTYVIEDSENLTYKQFINTFLKYDPVKPVQIKLSEYLGIKMDSDVMKKLEWLGLFSDKKVGLKDATPAQILQKILEEKWTLDPGDKDMIVMQHQFEYELNGKRKGIKSSLVVIGEDSVNTAMAITVGTPVAIATKLLLTGEIDCSGINIPTTPDIYDPVLNELEDYNVRFIEEEYDI